MVSKGCPSGPSRMKAFLSENLVAWQLFICERMRRYSSSVVMPS
jgi:hypothetical protein